MNPCPFCGTPMNNPRRKQCGAPDCKRAFNAERMRKWQQDYKNKHGRWYARVRFGDQQRAYSQRRHQELGHWRHRYPAAAAASDARRRALVAESRTDETFAPVDVHTRDGWICQLCQEPIDQAIHWPDTGSPSVDHIIPLSRGGAHSMANVQSAHLGCNSSKGNKLISELIRDLRSETKAW